MRTIGVYAGSFNPFHIGHLNILKKAQIILGPKNIIVAKGINPEKVEINTGNKIISQYSPNFKDDAYRLELQKKLNCQVLNYTGFLHELIIKMEKETPDGEPLPTYVLIRGLRNGDDLAYEEKQMRFIQHFKSDLQFMFLMCDSKYSHISSSAIRNLEKIEPGSGSEFIVANTIQ
jgi:pantetheine-phosphate adenylyltransferase